MNDSSEIVQRILSQVKGVKSTRNGYTFCCPAHNDHNPSAFLKTGTKRFFVGCRARCTEEQILAALGTSTDELFFAPRAKKNDPDWNLDDKILAIYPYKDESGRRLYEHVRMKQRTAKDPKCLYRRELGDGSYAWTVEGGWCERKGRDWFLIRRKDVIHSPDKKPPIPNARWVPKVERRVLYGLHELVKAPPGSRVFSAEGEKDVENLRRCGLLAVTAGGAKDWHKGYAEYFAGLDVVLTPDNDEAGRLLVEQEARDLYGIAAKIRICKLPGLKPKEDVSDWLEAGGTIEELEELIALTFPYFPPDPSPQEDEKIAPISEDKEREEFLWSLPDGSSRLLSAIHLLHEELIVEGDHSRLINALIIVGRNKKTGEYVRGTVEISHAGLASVYPNDGGRSADTVSRDIKKYLAAQANSCVKLLDYIQGSQDLRTGKNFKSKFRRHFLRYGLQVINLALELSGVEKFDNQALRKLTVRRMKEACKLVAAGIPRTATVPTKITKRKNVNLEAEKARAIQQTAAYLRHLLSNGKEVEVVSQEAEEVYLEALSRALTDAENGQKSAEPIVRMHADYRSAANEPNLEVFTV